MSSSLPTLVAFFDHTAQMGGGEVSLLNLVTHLDRRRFEPIVILGQDGPLREKFARVGVEVHVLPLASDVSEVRKDSLTGASALSWERLAASARYVWRLSRFLRARGAVFVHTNSLKSDLLGALAARLAGLPVIWHIRDRIADDYLPARAVQAFRVASRFLPTFVIANSQATLETLHLPRSQSAGVVYNGVVHDGLPSLGDESDEENGSDTGDGRAPIVALVGRISPWKGQDVFLRAAAQIVRHVPRARFQIIGAPLFGEGEWEAHLRGLCTELGLDANVEWLGYRSDVPDLVARCDVFVHASTTGEPFGQVVVEAMLAARPVVATRGGGIPEIVRDGETGFLVPMNDPDAMAQAVLRLLADPHQARELGQKGLRRAQDNFLIGHTVAGVEAVYERLLARASRARWRRFGALLVIAALALVVKTANRGRRGEG